ncbi:MAG TPA: zinc-dependent alcohol dehydrogenase family protein [Lacipirellulaceae bacterium]|jgi:propanol-preferring alcohol dehydrogenase|nr:zinc-dependent alcohol dehydrogenase family protein [Lacipirellulaceae bacterium]
MRAMVLQRTTSLTETDSPLELVDLPIPQPQAGELRIKVAACGVCHTELDEIEGRTPPPMLPVVLGHEVVGYVDSLGKGVTRFHEGQRVGVGWIQSSNGQIDENLSPAFRATGRDVNGGYAEYMTVPQNYAYPIPSQFSDAEAAPLLCAGAVGYRALRLTGLEDGQRLGLMGFGGSAHLVLQVARYQFPNSPIFVFARNQIARNFALQLGAVWAGDISDRAPEALHAIIDTTPAWRPIVEALANLRAAGRLVINAIRKEDSDKNCLQNLSYHDHLWMEREIKTVANVTHHDINEFLPIAAEIPIRPEVATYQLEDANQALIELKHGRVKGAKVLLIDQ